MNKGGKGGVREAGREAGRKAGRPAGRLAGRPSARFYLFFPRFVEWGMGGWSGDIPSAPTLTISLFLPFNVFTKWKRKGWVGGGRAPEFHTPEQKTRFKAFFLL